MSPDGIVLAVDGGGVKTDLALVDSSGALLSLVRGGSSQAHYLGVEGCLEVLSGLLDTAMAEAGLDPFARPVASTAQVLLAGMDLPEELAALGGAMERLSWSERLVLGNDTEALLRAGTDRGWGVAVVGGTGINCLGVARDRREARFLSFGPVSGDWGGGRDLGLAALAAAVRAADGRGPRTPLEDLVPAHFGLGDPLEVARAFHLEGLPPVRVGELAPVVLAVCDEDPVAAEIVHRLTDEVVAFAAAALRRLELTADDPDVVLGGSLLRAVSPSAVEAIALGVHAVAPRARVVVSPSEPIVGAALLGLDALGADAAARARARTELDAAAAVRSAAVVDRLG
ncbi:MAG TPA: BadF/BadG/BcrA/BcrD ATPase family protein [Solirubrobacteraceae bacterium]|nr:BadF/BadG/BcrA/BcrD ATPase family protein [Solirubrobacteraceae bacterium]